MATLVPTTAESARRWAETLRSVGVGALASAADLAALATLVGLYGMTAVTANVPALGFGLAIQFAGNKWVAFRNRAVDRRSLARQGIGFAAVELGALALNGLAFHLVVSRLPDAWLVARIGVGAAVYLLWSLPLWRRVFATSELAPNRGVTS